ncbi:hypothetical protein [Nocardioides sp.]|uniref:hypothetical protein n=1 Tax=Nocardioides sp. TaxID=35761 RepID=UPI00198A44D2|nr:hypothetical protein [Nocardioides sp.]MBC7277416.1 hypothetical protein [Nocardioides sp.]
MLSSVPSERFTRPRGGDGPVALDHGGLVGVVGERVGGHHDLDLDPRLHLGAGAAGDPVDQRVGHDLTTRPLIAGRLRGLRRLIQCREHRDPVLDREQGPSRVIVSGAGRTLTRRSFSAFAARLTTDSWSRAIASFLAAFSSCRNPMVTTAGGSPEPSVATCLCWS